MCSAGPLVLLCCLASAGTTSAAPGDHPELLKVDTSELPVVRIYVDSPDPEPVGSTARVEFDEPPTAETLAALAAARTKHEKLVARHQEAPDKRDDPGEFPTDPPTDAEADVLRYADQQDESEGALIVLLVDLSGSMKGDKLDEVRELGKALTHEIRSVDRVAILGFACEMRTLLEPTHVRASIAAALDELETFEKGCDDTQMFDALGETIQGFAQDEPQPSLPGRRYFFLFSDAEDNGSTLEAESFSAIRAQLADPPTVHTVCVGKSKNRDKRCDDLEKLAFYFGDVGHFHRQPEPIPFAEQFGAEMQRLDNQLLVQFELPMYYWRRGGQDAYVIFSLGGDEEISVPFTLRIERLTEDQAEDVEAYLERIEEIRLAAVGRKRTIVIAGSSAGAAVVLILGLILWRVGVSRRKKQIEAAAEAAATQDAQQWNRLHHEISTQGAGMQQQMAEQARRAADGQRTVLAVLFAADGPMKGQRFGLLKPRSTVGRDKGCDVVLPPTSDAAISRVHAEFRLDQGGWTVTCLSDGGLWVNRQQVRKGERYQAQVGDRIKLGGSVFELQPPQ